MSGRHPQHQQPMTLSQRIGMAWRALTGKRDSYVGVYGQSPRMGGFAGGAVGRLTASMATWSASVNSDLDGALHIMRARGRALAANNEHGRRFLSLVGANIVGRNNPQLQVRAYFQGARSQAPTLDKAANDAIETHWQRWGKTADITGKHRNLSGFWRMVAKAVARDGEALVRKVRDRNLPYGYALQALEADRLDENINTRLANGNAVRQGVEIDTTGRAVAYHIRSNHPGESFAYATPGIERVPAEDMLHIFLPERAEQVRGVTWFHAVIIRGSTIHRFEDAAVIAAEIGASKVAVLKSSADAVAGEVGAGIADGTSDGTARGIPQINAEAGEILDLTAFPGTTIEGWNPEYPHANFESFLKACLRGLAAGLDVAAHNLTGDMTDVNYSSARIAELAEREMWMCLQDWFIATVVEPIYTEWLAIALLRGDIKFEASGKAIPAERLEKFQTASRFLGRRWSWVDPAKEMEANQAGVQLGVTSRTRIAAEQGIDIEDVIDELQQERGLMSSAGLPLEVKPGTPAPAPAPKTPA
jgi:lambda family phage portal protein